MSDLVKRLRDKDSHSNFGNWLCLTDEAADHIDKLEQQRDELAAALRLAKAGIPTTSWVHEDIDAALANLDGDER